MRPAILLLLMLCACAIPAEPTESCDCDHGDGGQGGVGGGLLLLSPPPPVALKPPCEEPCSDGLFCTMNDHCEDGACVGGEENTCGMDPGTCEQLFCSEADEACYSEAIPGCG